MQLSSPLVRKLVNFGYLDQNKLVSFQSQDISLAEAICSASGMTANELSNKAATLFQSPHLSIKDIDLAFLPDGKERNEKLIKEHRVLPIACKGKTLYLASADPTNFDAFEDYEFNTANGHLDEHNGRFCVTPEYPNGIYAYFCTVDENWNSAYPYAVGPTFYGNWERRNETTISETVEVYAPAADTSKNDTNTSVFDNNTPLQLDFNVFPNPAQEKLNIVTDEGIETVALISLTGAFIQSLNINKEQAINVSSISKGVYLLQINTKDRSYFEKIVID